MARILPMWQFLFLFKTDYYLRIAVFFCLWQKQHSVAWIESKMRECFLAKTRLKEFSQKSKSWERANPTPSRKECSHKRFMLVLLGLFINSISAGILQQEIKDTDFFLSNVQIHRAWENTEKNLNIFWNTSLTDPKSAFLTTNDFIL